MMEQKNSQEKQKKPFSRANLVVISIIASIVLWVVIVQTVNPDISYIIADVPVKIIGEGTLRDRGIVVMNADEIPRFSVKISGNRNDVIQALDRVRINFDVSQVTQLGEFEVTPTVYAPQSINVESQNINEVMLRFEECTTKEVPVVARYTELSKSKVIEIIPDVETVTVSGAVSEMNALSKCIVTVDASDIKDTSVSLYDFVYADDNELELSEQKTLFSNVTKIGATTKLYDRIDFDYEIVLADDMKDKYKFDIDKETLPGESISGGLRSKSDEAPKKIKYIIPSDDYENGRIEIEVTAETNDDVFVTTKVFKVFANVTKLKTKKVNLTIEAINQPENMNVSFTKNITMDIVMPEDVDVSELIGYVDLIDKNEGKHTLSITFENPDVYAKNPEIEVILEKKGG